MVGLQESPLTRYVSIGKDLSSICKGARKTDSSVETLHPCFMLQDCNLMKIKILLAFLAVTFG